MKKVLKIGGTFLTILMILYIILSAACDNSKAVGRSFSVIATIEINEYAHAIAADDEAVCVACFGLGRVVLIDPEINEITLASPHVGAFFVTVGDGIAWFTNIDGTDMTKVDWEKGEVEQIRVGNYAGPIAYGGDSIWVLVGSELLRIDSQSNQIVETIDVDVGYITDIVCGDNAVWIIEKTVGSVARINPENNQLMEERIKVGQVPIAGACGEGSLWVANTADCTVSRIDQKTNKVTDTIRVGNDPMSITVGGGLVWVANNGDSTVSVIDPSLNEVIEEINIEGLIGGIAFGDGSAWILYRAEDNIGYVMRINP